MFNVFLYLEICNSNQGVSMSSSGHGGRRAGSGRKKGESTTVVRVPDSILPDVILLISEYKKSKLENSNVNQTKPLLVNLVESSNENQVNIPKGLFGCPVDPMHKPRNPHPKNLEKRERRRNRNKK